MRIIEEPKLDFSDILIVPKRSELSSRQHVKLERKFITKHGLQVITGIPIIAANMATGNKDMLNVLSSNKLFTAIAKHHKHEWENLVSWNNFNELENMLEWGFITIGMCEEDLHFLIKLRNSTNNVNWNKLKICIDIANGYSQKFANFVHSVRDSFHDNVIMAGNVCTPEMTQELILSGADIVKIGIGPGSACTTRLKTGVGYPQISACIENADVAHGLNGLICLDGGMTCPGDVAKAFCANADFVMIGGMFSGTDECEGEVIEKFVHNGEYKYIDLGVQYKYEKVIEKKFYKTWYGMSSDKAQNDHFGGKKDYRTSEGREELVECKGPVKNIVKDLLGGLRSTCTYIGAAELKYMGKCSTFCRVSHQHNRF